MKTVIEMAREAGIRDCTCDGTKGCLERFAELVRADAIADEREKYTWDVHSCGPTCTKAACVAMREAVKAEREALVESIDWTALMRQGGLVTWGNAQELGGRVVAAIQARSNT